MQNTKRAAWQKISVAAFVFLLGSSSMAMSGPKPPASEASASARQAIDEFNRKEMDACMKMDNSASAALWADDGVDLIEGLNPMIGKAAIVKWYESLRPQLHGAKMVYCTADWRKISIQGDWAWEWGINRQKINFPAPQKPYTSEGTLLFILKRHASGEWKIELEAWSSIPGPNGK